MRLISNVTGNDTKVHVSRTSHKKANIWRAELENRHALVLWQRLLSKCKFTQWDYFCDLNDRMTIVVDTPLQEKCDILFSSVTFEEHFAFLFAELFQHLIRFPDAQWNECFCSAISGRKIFSY